MLKSKQSSIAENSDEWATRSEFWLTQSEKSQRKRLIRARNPNPLILTGHGTTLRVEQGTLVIQQGFTHYPQPQTSYRFFRGELTLPRVIILLDGSGSLSFDVLSWLGEQGIALARIDWTGALAVFASGSGIAPDLANLRWQHEMQADDANRLEFARRLIAIKLENSVSTLQGQFADSPAREIAIFKAHKAIARLQGGGFSEMNEIRIIESECAVAYFSVWSEIRMTWMAEGKYPIPAQWRAYRTRSSTVHGHKLANSKAAHPINAMLNYAYAVRASQLQIQAVAHGFDPCTGIMHHDNRGYPAYVYDLIEPERPKVDALIIAFAQRQKFSGADFVLRKDGVCRLSPQLARAVASLCAKEFGSHAVPAFKLAG